jgi:hypothetical protein
MIDDQREIDLAPPDATGVPWQRRIRLVKGPSWVCPIMRLMACWAPQIPLLAPKCKATIGLALWSCLTFDKVAVGGIIEVGQIIGPVAVRSMRKRDTPYRYDKKTPHQCNMYFEVFLWQGIKYLIIIGLMQRCTYIRLLRSDRPSHKWN